MLIIIYTYSDFSEIIHLDSQQFIVIIIFK